MKYVLLSFLANPGPNTPETDRIWPLGWAKDEADAKRRILREASHFFHESIDLFPSLTVVELADDDPYTLRALKVTLNSSDNEETVHYFLAQRMPDPVKKPEAKGAVTNGGTPEKTKK